MYSNLNKSKKYVTWEIPYGLRWWKEYYLIDDLADYFRCKITYFWLKLIAINCITISIFCINAFKKWTTQEKIYCIVLYHIRLQREKVNHFFAFYDENLARGFKRCEERVHVTSYPTTSWYILSYILKMTIFKIARRHVILSDIMKHSDVTRNMSPHLHATS